MKFISLFLEYCTTRYFWQQIAIAVAVPAILLAIASIPAANQTPQQIEQVHRENKDPESHRSANGAVDSNQVEPLIYSCLALMSAALILLVGVGLTCIEAGSGRAASCADSFTRKLSAGVVTIGCFLPIGFDVLMGEGTPYYGLPKGQLIHALGDDRQSDNSPATGVAYIGPYRPLSHSKVPLTAKVLYQVALATIPFGIVSAAMAGRTKLFPFLLFSAILASLIYPVVAHWTWGGGWLSKTGFIDFAGGTHLHCVGGWAALAGAIMVRPRIDLYDRRARRLVTSRGHSLAMASIGGGLVGVGWVGFCLGGSLVTNSSVAAHVALSFVSAGTASSVVSILIARLIYRASDTYMLICGFVAGLVAISASCACVTVWSAAAIGALAAIAMVVSFGVLRKLRIDDPAGAVSVCLVCGALGTLCVGLFADPDILVQVEPGNRARGLFYSGGPDLLVTQLIGVAATGGYTIVVSLLTFFVIRTWVGLRVSADAEISGLDRSEHGVSAYNNDSCQDEFCARWWRR